MQQNVFSGHSVLTSMQHYLAASESIYLVALLMWAFVPSRAHSFYGLGVGDSNATWRWSYQASVVCGQTRNVNTYGCFLKKFHHSDVCARTWHLLKMCICIKIKCNLHGCHCSSLAKCMTSNLVDLTQGNTIWVSFWGFFLENGSCSLNEKMRSRLQNDILILKNHQIVSPISNSESTNFFDKYLLWFIFQQANWTNEEIVFFFNCSNREKFVEKIVKQIGENIWWIRYLRKLWERIKKLFR